MNALTFLGSNITLVKSHNLQAILLSLLDEGSLSRIGLAKKTGLSTTTVTNLITELLEQGIVAEEGLVTSDGPRRVGRPRTALRLVENARYAVGLHIGIGRFRVAVTNLLAESLHTRVESFDLKAPAENVIAQMATEIDCTIQESGVERSRVIGVGVGASGLVDYKTGVNVLAPNLGWREVPILSLLERQLGLPVTVDNNVRAMALGEALFGAGKGINSLAFVYGRVGVGAGIVVGGQIFRGSNAGAGEIGHTILVADGGEACRCGNTGCLETLISETVILREANELANRHPDTPIGKALHRNGSELTLEDVFEAIQQEDQELQVLLEHRACYLGMALANLINILNPELILLGGIFAQGADIFLPTLEECVRRSAFAGMGEKVSIQTTRFGWQAGVIGASALALTSFFYQQPEGI